MDSSCRREKGFAILNDCKYVNVSEGSINLTLLKAPLVPYDCRQGIHEFTYSFYLWNGNFHDSDVIR